MWRKLWSVGEVTYRCFYFEYCKSKKGFSSVHGCFLWNPRWGSYVRRIWDLLWVKIIKGAWEELCNSWFWIRNSSTCSQMWIHYMLGRIFDLRKYHLILKYLFNHPILNAKQDKWIEFLCEFDFEIKHINGKENKVVYSLSRRFHVSAINISKSNLNTRVIEAHMKPKTMMKLALKLSKNCSKAK